MAGSVSLLETLNIQELLPEVDSSFCFIKQQAMIAYNGSEI
jgi:hypothetical protein